MPYFDRFDICEAYLLVEMLWNVGGQLHERESNRRRRESTGVQLHRIAFAPSPVLSGPENLTENGREIFDALLERYGFTYSP